MADPKICKALAPSINSEDKRRSDELYENARRIVPKFDSIGSKRIGQEVAKLLKDGADLIAKKYDSEACLHYVLRVIDSHFSIIDDLLKFGASPNVTDNLERTPLIFMVDSDIGNRRVIKSLIAAGADVNRVDSRGWTSLHYAAERGRLDIVRILLSNGANLHTTNCDGKTALLIATQSESENEEIVKLLIAAGADVNKADWRGWKSLHYAAERGNSDVVRILIEAKADPNGVDNFGYTPLMRIAKSQLGKNEKVIEQLIAAGADVNRANSIGWTILHYAAERGRSGIVRLLLSKEASHDKSDIFGCTPLLRAVISEMENEEVIKQLIAAGADVSKADWRGCTSLHYAAKHGKPDVVRILIEAKANTNESDGLGRTPLLRAATSEKENKEVIEQLIAAGADVNRVDSMGWTSLHYATSQSKTEIVRLLLSAKADPDIANTKGETPLLIAARSEIENKGVIEQLIAAEANVNRADSMGWTSLHYAALHGKPDTVRMLLSGKASPDPINTRGETPLMISLDPTGDDKTVNERLDVARQLIESGADVVSVKNEDDCTILQEICRSEKIGMTDLVLSCEALRHAVDENGCNALFYAAKYGYVDVVGKLIDAGCDINYVNENDEDYSERFIPRTALRIAVRNRDEDMLRCLLERDADPNIANDRKGKSVLYVALENYCNKSMVELLLDHKADLYDGGIDNPESPSELLISEGRASELRLLLEHGLDLGKFNPEKPLHFSPLHKAIDNGESGILSLLLIYNTKNSLNLEYEDENGDSPLCKAVRMGSSNCVKLLLKAGADVEHADRSSKTPLELAVGDRCDFNPECVGLLVRAGAKIAQVLGKLTKQRGDRTKRNLEKAKCIVRYRALFENQSPADDEHLESFINCGGMPWFEELHSYYEGCKTERNTLENSQLYKSITYYDLLNADEDFYKRVIDDQLCQTFDEKSIRDRFPLYAEDLCKSYKSIEAIYKTWKEAVNNLG